MLFPIHDYSLLIPPERPFFTLKVKLTAVQTDNFHHKKVVSSLSGKLKKSNNFESSVV